MFSLLINSTKILLIGLWGLALLSVFSISPFPAEYQSYILPFAGLVLGVHFIEYLVMKGKVKNIAKEMNLIQTLLWGFGYWLPLLKNNQSRP